VAYEIEQQTKIWESGGTVTQQTMGWNEAEGVTVPQRGKEHAHDYRYFPEPDLPPLVIAPERVARVRARLPELPNAKRARFEAEYGLTRYDAELLVEEQTVAAYFEQVVIAQRLEARNPKAIANWITGELFRLMKESGEDISAARTRLTPANLAALTEMIAGNAINLNTAKAVFEEMYRTGRAPQAIVEEKGLGQVSDVGEIEALIAEVLRSSPDQAAAYLGGKATVEQWFFGQVMKKLQGRGNPQVIRQTLAEALEKLKHSA